MLRLLGEAGVPFRVGWQNFIVVQNYAPRVPDRGFNFVVLNGGTPEFFGKCRLAGNQVLSRETRIRSCLTGIRPEGLSVPAARDSASARIALQIGPFIRGPSFSHTVLSQSTADYLATLRSILQGAADLADIAQNACEGLMAGRVTDNLRASSSESLAYVTPLVPLREELLHALSTTLSEAGDTPSRLQHGDLWERNLLIDGSLIWAVDFEHYGKVHVALYDDLTLLSSTLERRSGRAVGGLEMLIGPGAEAKACRGILSARASSEGLDLAQLDGILAYYVVHRAVTVHKSAGMHHARPLLDDVGHVAERFLRGERGLLLP